MGRRVPRDSGTSPRDVVKVTGWAIRCTILRNNPERHLRRSLITFEDEAEGTTMKLRNGKDNYERVKFAFTEKENRIGKATTERPFQFSNPFYILQIVLCGTDMFVAFLCSNYSSTSLSHGAKFRRVISFVAELAEKS